MFRGHTPRPIWSVMFAVALLGCEKDPSFTIEDSKLQDGQVNAQNDLDASGIKSTDADESKTIKCQTDPLTLTNSCDLTGANGIGSLGDRDGDGISDDLDAYPDDPTKGGGTAGNETTGGNENNGGNEGNENTGGNENNGGNGGNENNGGNGGTTLVAASDSFTQTAQSKPLDIVVVVDNSGSMAEEQANLSTKLTRLLDFADTADWRIGVRTTDSRVAGINYLSEKADASKTFEQKKTELGSVIQGFGISGSGREEGIPMAVEGLSANAPSSSSRWVRSDSMVAVLIVSDEDNCSNGMDCTPAERNEASYLLNYLTSSPDMSRVLGTSAKVYGLIRRDSAECLQAASVGTKYMDAINASGGLAGRICDEDYSSTLSAISADIGQTLELNFTLAHTPVVSSIVIKVDGAVYTHSFLVNDRTVALSDPPPAGAQIEISYNYEVN